MIVWEKPVLITLTRNEYIDKIAQYQMSLLKDKKSKETKTLKYGITKRN